MYTISTENSGRKWLQWRRFFSKEEEGDDDE